MKNLDAAQAQSLMADALRFVAKVTTGDIALERLRPGEVGAVKALEYFAATRKGEERDVIPFSLSVLFPPPPRSFRWWTGDPDPIPFRPVRVMPEKGAREDEFEPVDETFAQTMLSLCVLEVADRFKRAA